jgi:MFS family permease
MVEAIRKTLRDSKAARWTALAVVAFTMLTGYYLADVMAPLKGLLEGQLQWDSSDFGFFTSAYGWFNVFLIMLIIGGIILDKMGVRFTGLMAASIMVVGTAIKYWAVSTHSLDGVNWHIIIWDAKAQVFMAGLGFAIFGVGVEVAGITVSKIIVKWFKGKELALAMGLEMATARLGTALALSTSVPVAKAFNAVSAPILVCLIMLCIGLIAFIIYTFMDKKLDASQAKYDLENKTVDSEESFQISDIWKIVSNKGWWYIAILCVLFYSAVFPFLKYATDLMVQKFNINEDWAGIIPAMLPFGTILLTPLFGNLYDHKGKGATIMIIGSLLLIFVHSMFAIPFINHWFIAILLILVLGVGFSLVPSAMWPSVPKIIPEKQLGTAYSLIFWVQNWGLMGVPALIGWVLSKYCFIGYFAILGTGFITHQGDNIVKVRIDDQRVFDLKTVGSIGRKDTTIQVTQFIKSFDGKVESLIVSSGDTIQRINISDKAFKKVEKKNEVKVPLYSFEYVENNKTYKSRIDSFITDKGERVTKYHNITSFYNYNIPMLIFMALGILGLVFAFLLKAEDKKKGYGLQLPNIQK